MMTWLLDLIFHRELRRQRKELYRRLKGTRYAMHKAEHCLIAMRNDLMPRAEYARRCGYRFPLPPHMRPQEATNGTQGH